MAAQNGITIIGLGPGGAELLTREAWQALEQAQEVYLRTRQHPAVENLPDHLTLHSFDHLYEELDDYSQVYAQIVEQVISWAKKGDSVVYAVPGHPYVAEATSPEIVSRAKLEGISVRVIEGLSFLEPTMTALDTDPLPQLTVVDAMELVVSHHPLFPPSVPALIVQVYSKSIAAELKITLMAQYPDEFLVQLVHNAGSPQQLVETLPLHQIDQSEHIGKLTSLYLPPLGARTSFEGFQELIAHLRAPEGCPWDREQTHQTLRANLLEEAYEAVQAIDADDVDMMQEEFGDLLLQVVLQAQIAAEYGEFTMADVIQGIHTKLVYRHPHVFEDVDLGDSDAVIKNWERLKELEREKNHQKGPGLLDGIPAAMPALAVADNYQRRAARVGFDWPDIQGVIDKLQEEINELQQAKTPAEKEEELGDLLFAMVNLARWLGIDPETALRQTNAKFLRRFSVIEAQARKQGKQLSDMTLDEMDAIWEGSKNSK